MRSGRSERSLVPSHTTHDQPPSLPLPSPPLSPLSPLLVQDPFRYFCGDEEDDEEGKGERAVAGARALTSCHKERRRMRRRRRRRMEARRMATEATTRRTSGRADASARTWNRQAASAAEPLSSGRRRASLPARGHDGRISRATSRRGRGLLGGLAGHVALRVRAACSCPRAAASQEAQEVGVARGRTRAVLRLVGTSAGLQLRRSLLHGLRRLREEAALPEQRRRGCKKVLETIHVQTRRGRGPAAQELIHPAVGHAHALTWHPRGRRSRLRKSRAVAAAGVAGGDGMGQRSGGHAPDRGRGLHDAAPRDRSS
eukprot:751277-Hanusia_phi.AAC.1